MMTFSSFSCHFLPALFLIGCTLELPASAQPSQRPNIVFILSDDQGTLDVNIYGATDLYTPNLDQLARDGIRFTQFYAASAICTPSRGAILTGRYPINNGALRNSEGLHPDEVTIAEMLKASGYRTGAFGKWHLGHGRPDADWAEAPGPNAEGFDESLGHLSGVIDKYSHFNYGGMPWGDPPRRHDLHRNGVEIWESGIHSGDLIVREASRFIEQHQNEPFFLYLAFGSPHYPMQPLDAHRERYADLPEPRRSYAALVTTLDYQIGQVIAKVNQLGIRENTLIIFQSDHGHSVEARANHGGGYAGPYRGSKGSLFEAGIRVPAIVSWPGVIEKNGVRDQISHATDWLPTLAAVTASQLPSKELDGKNIFPLIQSADAPSPHSILYWHMGQGPEAQWAVRKGPWKLIGNPRDPTRPELTLPEYFLTNLEKDPTETSNFIEAHPEVVAELLERYRTFDK